jgi:hypothetical protein
MMFHCCFTGSLKTSLSMFMASNLLNCISFICSAIQLLDMVMCKFILYKLSMVNTNLRDYKHIQFVWNISQLFQKDILLRHNPQEHAIWE